MRADAPKRHSLVSLREMNSMGFISSQIKEDLTVEQPRALIQRPSPPGEGRQIRNRLGRHNSGPWPYVDYPKKYYE